MKTSNNSPRIVANCKICPINVMFPLPSKDVNIEFIHIPTESKDSSLTDPFTKIS